MKYYDFTSLTSFQRTSSLFCVEKTAGTFSFLPPAAWATASSSRFFAIAIHMEDQRCQVMLKIFEKSTWLSDLFISDDDFKPQALLFAALPCSPSWNRWRGRWLVAYPVGLATNSKGLPWCWIQGKRNANIKQFLVPTVLVDDDSGRFRVILLH